MTVVPLFPWGIRFLSFSFFSLLNISSKRFIFYATIGDKCCWLSFRCHSLLQAILLQRPVSQFTPCTKTCSPKRKGDWSTQLLIYRKQIIPQNLSLFLNVHLKPALWLNLFAGQAHWLIELLEVAPSASNMS